MSDSSSMVNQSKQDSTEPVTHTIQKNKYIKRNELLLSLSKIKPDEFINQECVKCVDFNEKENMYLFSYGSGTSDMEEEVKKCRGRVYDNSGKLIMNCFNYVDELSPSTFREKHPHFDISQYNCFMSREGTVIRVFCHNDKWFLSTHKRLDAYKSKWSSKQSFGELFEKNILTVYKDMNEFFSKLNKENTYAFLILSTPENRIVNTSSNGEVYHVYTLHGEKVVDDDVGIIKFEPLSDDLTIDDIYKIVSNVDPLESQGVIFFHKTKNYQIKMVNNDYTYLSSLRGNEPSIKFRYIQIRNETFIHDFINLYKEYNEWFVLYESIINETISDIFSAFITRYINRDYIMIPQKEYIVLQKCKKYVDSKPVNYKLTLEDVSNFFNELNCTQINKIIKDRYFSYTPQEYYKTPGRNFFFDLKNA